MRQLLEQARAPGAARAEVDALVRGLGAALAPGEETGERAELLQDILADKRVGSFKASNGRQVSHAAVEALAGLGSPYALRVPPQLLTEARVARFRLALPELPREESWLERVSVVEWSLRVLFLAGMVLGLMGMIPALKSVLMILEHSKDIVDVMLAAVQLIGGLIYAAPAGVLCVPLVVYLVRKKQRAKRRAGPSSPGA